MSPDRTAEELVDVHAHFVTDRYRTAAREAGHQVPDGMPAWPEWSSDTHLAMMDAHRIRTAVLSVSSPGVHFGDDRAAAALARHVNDFAAELQRSHPDRFRQFASLPLPDVPAALSELDRACDDSPLPGWSSNPTLRAATSVTRTSSPCWQPWTNGPRSPSSTRPPRPAGHP